MSFGGTQGAIRYVLTVDDTQATGKINNFKNALRGMDTSVNSSATGLGKINTAMTGMDARTSKLGMVMTGLKNNFGAITTSVGAAMSSVVNLNRAWQDLGDTQIAVDRTALKMSRTQEAVTKAQDKLNQLTNDGLKGTVEYEQAVTDLQQAEEAAALAVTMHGEALEDQQRTYENFYMNIFTTAISSVGTLGTAIQALGSAGVISLTKLAGAVKGLGLSMNMLTTGGIVGLVITGIALFGKALYDLKVNIDNLRDSASKLETEVVMPVKDFIFGGAIQTADLKTIDDYLTKVKAAIKEKEDLKKNSDIWGKSSLLSDQDLPELRDAEKILTAITKGFGGVVEVKDLANHSTFRYNGTAKQFNAIMGTGEMLISGYTSAYQNMAVVQAQSKRTLSELIAEQERNVQAQEASNTALSLINRQVIETESNMPGYTKQIEDNAKATEEWKKTIADIEAAWESWNDQMDRMFADDKKDFKKYLKKLGFGKEGRSLISEFFGDRQTVQEVSTWLEDSLRFILSTDMPADSIGKWADNFVETVKDEIGKSGKDKDILQPLVDVIEANRSNPKGIPAALATLFQNNPEILQKLKDMGVDIETLMGVIGVNASTEFGSKFSTNLASNMDKFVKIGDDGKTTTVGNPLTGLINVMTKSIDQTINYITSSFSSIKLAIPAVDMSTYAGNLNDAVSAAKSTAKSITKNLKVKFPAIDMDTYAGNLNDAVTAAKDTRKKIEKALQSEIKIKVSFDVDDLPEYKTKTTSSGVKLVKAA
ncbi:MAG: hypothetical protein CV087_10210, partial [Candidatus Brocadia sp. WS118]